ncbi:MAG: hypothetical protein WBQ26_09590 [Gemmatimonadaceae bacterium]|nr:hypothetical protein [Gemmatimonadaceae bacterium]
MMRRIVALLLVAAGLCVVARPAAAQSSGIAPLPSGVTLRVNGPGSTITGVLYQQSIDSVWLRPRGENEAVRAIAVSRITRVDAAQPAYAKSVLVGTGLGLLLGAALYPITSHNDHDVFIGLSLVAGAAAGLIFPHTDWTPVPFR